MTGEHAGQLGDRGLHAVGPGDRVEEPVERGGDGAQLVGGVDRQAAAGRSQPDQSPVRVALRSALDVAHLAGQLPHPDADDDAGQPEVHRGHQAARGQRRSEERRPERGRGRYAERHDEERKQHADGKPEPDHVDREVAERAVGQPGQHPPRCYPGRVVVDPGLVIRLRGSGPVGDVPHGRNIGRPGGGLTAPFGLVVAAHTRVGGGLMRRNGGGVARPLHHQFREGGAQPRQCGPILRRCASR